MGLHFNAHGCSAAMPRLRTLLYIAGANLLVLHSAEAAAATYFDLNLTSIHSRPGWKSKGRVVAFNDDNLGLGLTHEIGRFLEVKAGFYNNSFYKISGYALINFVYHGRLGPITVAPGFGIGAVSGYRGTSCDYTHGRSNVQPAVLPNLSIGIDAFKLNIGAIPKLKGNVNVITFQLEARLPD